VSEQSDAPPDVHADALDRHLSESIDFQRRWKRRTAGVYYTTTILTIVSASIATLVGGLGIALGAAIAAAVAAIASGLEKGLVFRDKWGHHRNIEAELTMIQLKRQVGRLDLEHALAEIENITRQYATRLPVESSSGEHTSPVESDT
jgi:hypothetical protein